MSMKERARLRLPGTPSLIVNGKRYSSGISEEELAALIEAAR